MIRFVNEYYSNSRYIGFHTNLLSVLFVKHDNCCGDPEMRINYRKYIGWFRPIWNRRPLRKTLEVGAEINGIWYTLFFEG